MPMIQERLTAQDWPTITATLDEQGVANLPHVLDRATCAAITACYAEPQHFRSKVIMAHHGYGQGEYQYFADPLPSVIQQLREQLYLHLVALANQWQQRLGQTETFPEQLADYLAQCHQAGQSRPTPLLLRYETADYNCLHQDLYGSYVFPLQVVILLSEPQRDFEGGEFVLVEQRPRRQSKVLTVPLRQGDAAIFAVHHRPQLGNRGYYRMNLKHGVSVIHSGQRFALGIIFHNAK